MQLLILATLAQLALGIPTEPSSDSHGFITGNTINAPIHAPVNSCNNAVTTIGGSNQSVNFGCSNTSIETDTDSNTNADTGSSSTDTSYPSSTTDSSDTSNSNDTPSTDTNYPSDNSDTKDNSDTSDSSDTSDTTYPDTSTDDNGSLVGNTITTPLHIPVHTCNNAMTYVGGVPNFDFSCINTSIESGSDTQANNDSG